MHQTQKLIVEFLLRDAMHKRSLCRHAVSVCVSVTFVNCVKTNKQIIKKCSSLGRPIILVFFHAKRHSNTPTGTLLTGASNAGGVDRNRDSEPIAIAVLLAVGIALQQARCCQHGRRWTTATVPQVECNTSLVVSGSVDCGRRRRNVYDKMPQRYAIDNRTAHLTARSDKSVAYVTNNKVLYSTFCTVEANY